MSIDFWVRIRYLQKIYFKRNSLASSFVDEIQRITIAKTAHEITVSQISLQKEQGINLLVLATVFLPKS